MFLLLLFFQISIKSIVEDCDDAGMQWKRIVQIESQPLKVTGVFLLPLQSDNHEHDHVTIYHHCGS